MMGFPTCSNLFQRKYGRSSSLPGHICPSQPTFTVLVHISSGTVCSLKFLTNKSWLRLLGDVLGDTKKCPRHSRNRFLKWWMIPQMVDLYMWIYLWENQKSLSATLRKLMNERWNDGTTMDWNTRWWIKEITPAVPALKILRAAARLAHLHKYSDTRTKCSPQNVKAGIQGWQSPEFKIIRHKGHQGPCDCRQHQ